MKKIKEIILGLILGFVLVFLLALEPQKVSASNLSDLSDLTNVELNWNTTLDWSIITSYEEEKGYKNGTFNIQNCSFTSYASEYTSLQILTKSTGNNQLKYNNTTVYSYNEWNAQAYQLNNWKTAPTKVTYNRYNANSQFLSNDIYPGDEEYTVLTSFINSNTTANYIYTLTYNGNGATSGTVPPIENHSAGPVELSANYNPGNLAKEGYVFLGWNTNASATTPIYEINMTSNTTVYAVWSRIEYTLSFNGNGQTTGTPPENMNVGSNENVKLSDIGSNTLAKAGYVFLGWNTNASATSPLTDITIINNTTVYAVWQKLVYYNLTFNGNGATSGTTPPVKNVVDGSTVDLENYNPGNLAKEGYVFLGWNTDASAESPLTDITITSNTTVYAVWSKKPIVYYTLTYNSNGATSGTTPEVKNVVEGSKVELENYNPGNLAKEGYVFLGWNTDASAESPLTDITITSNTTVYAIWGVDLKKVNIKITCRDNVVWQGNATFSNNKIVGGVDWSNPTMALCYFNNVDSQNIILINDTYGNDPNFANNQLMLFFKTFSTETDENGRYLAFVNLIKITTPKGSYAHNFEITQNPKNIDFEQWLDSENLTNLLNVDTDNYYFNLEVSWSLEEPQPPGVAEWGNVATIMARIMASVTTLLNINIGFITLGNLLLIVISLSVLFFIIKVWRGGN